MKLFEYALKSRFFLGAAFCLSCLVLLSGCSMQPLDPEYFLNGTRATTYKRFRVCHGYGCALHSYGGFSKEEWHKITVLFKFVAKTSTVERENIAKTISMMEHYSGKKTGTHTDIAQAQFKMLDSKQMDCIDETINTNQYLELLEDEDLFVWHSVGAPIRRGYFVDGEWPHNTATIKEKETGQVYTVDSWFGANGDLPHIIKVEIWLSGWRPEHDALVLSDQNKSLVD